MSALTLFRKSMTRRRATLRVEELEDRTVPTLLGQQLYPSDNAWNQKITDAPVASNSAAIINNIITSYSDGRLHPDFSQDFHDSRDLYGIPYNIVHGNSTPLVSVVIDDYPDESDIVPAPIPVNAVLEGDYQNGPKPGGTNARGDSHLIVYDIDNQIAYEYYAATRPSENADGRWHAAQQTVWDMKTNSFRTLGWTSADAAGLSVLAGLVRPDEGLPVSQGGQGVINHAIRFTLRNSIILDQFLYPASHTANPGNNNVAIQPPMGARFRLKASVDISQFNPQARIIAQAMKDYGMILADNGSNFYFSGASSAVDAANNRTLTWDDDDIQDSVRGLKSLRYSMFEVVDPTPVVTDLSAHTGPAGTSVTVIGQNFSGAAGRLQVHFGSTPATSVTVVDDTHVIAVAPAGSGTVDVRVQSGLTTGANSDNYKSPVFGYGISAITANDRFTYGTGQGNTAPTVATAASASPNPVNGTTTALSVLGADDGGEANLRYAWTSSGPAAVTFSANNTNAAKNATATFTQSGTYTLVATITDVPGLSVTSTVQVTVNIPPTNSAPTVATAASASPNPVNGTTTALSVLGADDGGEANLRYTWSSSGPASVTFSANGTNAAKNATATFTQSGTYTFVATITDVPGLSVTSTIQVTVTVPPTNTPPTVVQAASASPNPVTGTTTALSVLGADNGGEPNLRYTWTSSGPAPVTFSANGTNAAKNTTATFSKAGNYTFVATITDAAGLSVTNTTQVTVTPASTSIVVAAAPVVTGQTLTYIVVKAPVRVKVGRKVRFRAMAFDQFGVALAVQPIFTWALSGKGKLNRTGRYRAPRRPGGPYTIRVSAGPVTTTVKIIVDG